MSLHRVLPISFLVCALLTACDPESREYLNGSGGNGGAGGNGGHGGEGGNGGSVGIPCSEDVACAPGYCGPGVCVTPELVAGGQSAPTALAIASDFVYWTNAAGGQIMRWSKASGGSAEAFVVAQKKPSHIIEYGGVLYWGNQGDGSIARAKTADSPGGVGETLLMLSENPARMVTNGVNLFIAGSSYLWTAPVTGGPPAELLPDPNWYGDVPVSMPAGIAMRGDVVYWSEYLGGRAAKLEAGVVSVLAPGPGNLGTIATDESGVYWMSIDNGVKLWGLEAGGATALFQGEKEVLLGIPKVVVDASAAYFSVDPEGSPSLIRRREKSTGSVRVLASEQAIVSDIAIDATHLYWISESSVYRIALP